MKIPSTSGLLDIFNSSTDKAFASGWVSVGFYLIAFVLIFLIFRYLFALLT